MFNLNQNKNNKNNFLISGRLNEYYKKAKKDSELANTLFPTMRDKKDAMEDEIEQWEKSNSISENNSSIKIPKEDKEETYDEQMTRFANALYPKMRDREEKSKENNSSELSVLLSKKDQRKLSHNNEVPKYADLALGLFVEDKRPLRKDNNKLESNYFDNRNKNQFSYQNEVEKMSINRKKDILNIPHNYLMYNIRVNNSDNISNNKIKKREVDNTFLTHEAKEKAKEFIQNIEGLKSDAYQDTGGVWTIGYGHTKNVKPGDKITQEEAGRLFVEDFKHHSEPLKYVRVELSNNEKIALISFTYNVGVSAFKNSTLLKKLNEGDKKGAADEFDKWIYDNGKVNKGLINRRAKEKKKFLTPDN